MEQLPPLVSSENHKIYFQLPLIKNLLPAPITNSEEATEEDVTFLPHLQDAQRWEIISKALQTKIKNMKDLEQIFSSYDSEVSSPIDLEKYIETLSDEEQRTHFFENLIPRISNLALQLPRLFHQNIILLKKKQNKSVSLSQEQIGCLLANAFFCTLEKRVVEDISCGKGEYPDINFNRLLNIPIHIVLPKNNVKQEQYHFFIAKWKCLLHYFDRITTEVPKGVVTFTRQYIDKEETLELLKSSTELLTKVEIKEEAKVEDQKGYIQLDFADKYIGGQVLSMGCVQEEILFVLYPELIVSRLFTQVLEDTEAFIIKGAERFNYGEGYSRKFRWSKPYVDETSRDRQGRMENHIIAIDALNFNFREEDQYFDKYMIREMIKAYAGYKQIPGTTGGPTALATGNWGCGVFQGDPRLKFLLQLVAAAQAKRNVLYLTFDEENLAKDLKDIYSFLRNHNCTVGEIVNILLPFAESETTELEDLYVYIKRNIKKYPFTKLFCCSGK